MCSPPSLAEPWLRYVELIVFCRRPLPSYSCPFVSSASLFRVFPDVHLLVFFTAVAPLRPSGAIETDPRHHGHLATPLLKAPGLLQVLP